MGRTKIDGDKILDESLESKDIKDGTLAVSDISAQALTDLENELGFDPTGTELLSTKLGNAVRELSTTVGASASPGFSFGRSANAGPGTWLQIVGGVPSNKTGITVAIQNAELILVSVGNEVISTFDVTIYEHEGDEVNLTALQTVSIINNRSGNFEVSVPVTNGRQVAARITSGSAKNVGVSLQLKGSTT